MNRESLMHSMQVNNACYSLELQLVLQGAQSTG